MLKSSRLYLFPLKFPKIDQKTNHYNLLRNWFLCHSINFSAPHHNGTQTAIDISRFTSVFLIMRESLTKYNCFSILRKKIKEILKSPRPNPFTNIWPNDSLFWKKFILRPRIFQHFYICMYAWMRASLYRRLFWKWHFGRENIWIDMKNE